MGTKNILLGILIVAVIGIVLLSGCIEEKPKEEFFASYNYGAECAYEKIEVNQSKLIYTYFEDVNDKCAIWTHQVPCWKEEDLKTKEVTLSEEEIDDLIDVINQTNYMDIENSYGYVDGARCYSESLFVKIKEKEKKVIYFTCASGGIYSMPDVFKKVKDKLFEIVDKKFNIKKHKPNNCSAITNNFAGCNISCSTDSDCILTCCGCINKNENCQTELEDGGMIQSINCMLVAGECKCIGGQCKFFEEKPKENTTQISDENYNDTIKKFSSQEDLNAYIKYSAESGIGYYGGGGYAPKGEGGDMIVFSATKNDFVQESASDGASKTVLTGSNTGSSTSEFSQTNIQVKGVDEADIVKNDGKYIYVVSGKKIVIIDGYPAKNAKILSEIKFNETPSEIFINKDKLVVFTQEYNYNSRQEYYYGSQTKTNIAIYDISDRKNPKIEREISADGNYFDSRMIGDYVYVIINEPIYYQPCRIYKGAEVDMKCITEDIKFPEVTMDGKKTDENFPEIYYWDIHETSYRFTTILSVDTQDKDAKPNKKFLVMSDAQNIYVSPENIYVTRTKWMSRQEILEKVYDEVVIPNLPKDKQDEIKEIENSNKSFYVKKFERILVIKEYFANLDAQEMQDFQKKINDKMQEIQNDLEKSGEQTVINRIGIKDGRITPKASGSVPGTILNQFSMDEYNKNFRIATTTQKGNDKQANNIYVLDENLKIIGKVEDIAPGESIYSVRFMGKKAYMVTFKRVDPLFVIDLSNPEKPTLVGKLKIPGYSDYLHPYDENHLIGIGKEVDESIDADKVHSSDAVYYTAIQGIKLALFDVSDIEHPVEMYKVVIGDRGTESEATQDHKAFLFDKEKNLLVIPIKLAEISDAQKKSSDWKGMEGEFTFQGAYIYDISLDKGFKLRGRVTHIDDPEVLMKSGYYFDSPYSVKRSLYMDDVLYTISDKKVKMNDLKNITYINEVKLPYEKYNDGRRYYVD